MENFQRKTPSGSEQLYYTEKEERKGFTDKNVSFTAQLSSLLGIDSAKSHQPETQQLKLDYYSQTC